MTEKQAEKQNENSQTSRSADLNLISRRAFMGRVGKAIAGLSLSAAIPPLPKQARTFQKIDHQQKDIHEEGLDEEEQYDLSDYRLPFDGTYNITQGRSRFTIDHQECTVQFHTTHQGLALEAVDFSMLSGVPIKAAQAGEVIRAGWLTNYGNVVIIQHSDGLTSWYGHLSKLAVREGDEVQKGQLIGDSGKSGTKASHLHFEIRNANNQSIPITIDGLQYFGGFNESCSYTERFEGYGQYPPDQKNDQNLTEFNPQKASIIGKDN